jgi:hypothetical protein
VVLRTFSPARARRRAVASRLTQTLGRTKFNPVAILNTCGELSRFAQLLRGTAVPRSRPIGSQIKRSAPCSRRPCEKRASFVGSQVKLSLRKVPRHQPRQKPAVLSVSLLSALRASVLRRAVSQLLSPQASTRASARFAVGSLLAPAFGVAARGCSTQRSLRSAYVARGLTLRSTGEPTAHRQARAGGTRYIFASPGLAARRCLPVNSNVRPHENCPAPLTE